jgi:AcrR family transcriptional regulator
MPRAFTPDESAAIRANLMAAGVRCFAAKGIRKTTVDELARAAGISKGAFYGFFDSKEALAVALVEDYETRAHAEIEAAIVADPERGIDTLIQAALAATNRNPLISVMMSEEGLLVLRGMSEPQRADFIERDVVLVNRVLSLLHQAGTDVAVDPGILVALLRSLVFVGWHRGDIGADLVDDLERWLIPTLRAALLSQPRDATVPVTGEENPGE